MSEELVIVDKEDLTAIADAVRESTGSTEEFNVSKLRTAAVVALSAGGGGTAVLDAAKEYTDNKVAELINGAPTTMDTLKEVADAMAENASVVEALDSAIGSKADANTVNTHISNKSNPHSVTAAQVGAAPSGYGLGTTSGRRLYSETDVNNAKASGYYDYNSTKTIYVNGQYQYQDLWFKIDTETVRKAAIEVAAVSSNVIVQRITIFSGTDTLVATRVYTGQWQPWEWVTPPLEVDSEYRTIERIEGKAVYKKKDSSGQILYRLDGETEWKSQAGLIGAAPAGLIANNISCTTNAEIENAITSEWSKMADNSIRHLTLNVLATGLTLFGGNWQITLHQASYAYGTLTAINYSYNGLTMQRKLYGGVWGEWEYVNPPMMLGQEYRTTERWNGEAVYTKLINCGAMPNASEKIIGHGVSGMKQPLSVSITASKSNWAFTLPSSHTNEASVLLNTNGIQITTTIDRSEYTAYALIKYTKN